MLESSVDCKVTLMSTSPSLIDELKRRNVLKLVTAYAVAGFVVLQLCDILFPAIGVSDEVIGYVLIVLLIGLPFVAVFAWMFEVTPEGLKRTREVDEDDSITQSTGQRINNIIIGLLSVAVIFFAWEYFNRPDQTETEVVATEAAPAAAEAAIPASSEPIDARPSIAVLPFVNMSSDKENEYFSDGLSEELLNLLAQIPGLRVAGRTSSFFYKGKNQNLTQIGEDLNVDHILEGSVRKSGKMVRITAQLISSDDGFHLWSKTYDREIVDIFAVQDEIAAEVTRAMELTLLSDNIMISDRSTTNPETYDLYLRAKDALYTRTLDSIRLSISLFEEAYTLDPEYAPAYIDAAVAELVLNNNHQVGTREAALIKARDHLEQAEQLGHLNSDYYAALGLYYSDADGFEPDNYEKAKNSFDQALVLNDNNVRAYMWYATMVIEQGTADYRHERGMELVEKARKLDPLNRVANGNYVIHLADNGRFDDALRTVNRLIRTDPGYDFYHLVRTNLHLSTYDLVNAAEAVKTVKLTDRAIIFIMMRMFRAFDDVENYIEFLGMVPIDNPQYELLPYMEMSFTATTAELRAEAEVALLRQQPDLPFWLMFGLMDHGEWDLVKDVIENARPYFADDDYTNQINGEDPNFPYMLALYELGETARARRFAESLLQYQSRSHILGPRGKGIGDAACHMVLGNYEQAVEAYVEAIDAGWLGHYQFTFTRNDLFEGFFDDVRIQESIKRVDAELEKQRPVVYETLRDAGLITSI